jgi:hypothetical protein
VAVSLSAPFIALTPSTHALSFLTLCSSLVVGVKGVVADLMRAGAYAGREAGFAL